MSAERSLASPRIKQVSWGRVSLEGETAYRDAKLFPGGSREWDWNETGTRHSPGVQPADVEELLEHGAKRLVLSRGFYKRLEVPRETIAYLEQRGVPVDVLPTDDAVQRYNELCGSEPVGALIHSIC